MASAETPNDPRLSANNIPSTDRTDDTDSRRDALTRLQRPAAAYGRAKVGRGPAMSFMIGSQLISGPRLTFAAGYSVLCESVKSVDR